MRTPVEYTKNLKDHVITQEMLLACLFSSNKRAKNWRDKEREYREKSRSRYYSDEYDNEGKAREKKEEYYHQKKVMLSVMKPICIHREYLYDLEQKERIYDYEDEYWEYKEKGLFVHTGHYFDRDNEEEVHFGDIVVESTPLYRYYLFYDVGSNRTFHNPINKEDLSLYDNLEVVDIDKLDTKGYDIADLLSTQFVKKVIELIESEDFTYVA